MSEQHHPFGPSSLKRRELCPGSYRLEALCKEQDGGDELAARGTKIHAAIAAYISGKDYDGKPLDAQEAAILESLVDFWEKFRATLPEGSVITAERHLEVNTFAGPLFYGTSDVVVSCPDNTARVIDWKTGYAAVDDAADNLQGAAYALAAQLATKAETVEVVFYNPVIHQLSRHEFTRYVLANVQRQIMDIVARAQGEDAPCVPGKAQCQYCKAAAAGVCPAFNAEHQATAALAETGTRIPYTRMQDDALAAIYERCQLVAKVTAAVEAELKRRIEASGSCAGYTLKASSGGRECKDLSALYNAVGDVLDQPEFLSCCTVSVSALEKAYAKACKTLGLHPTEKAAREAFQSETAGIVAEKAPRKSIVKEV